MTRGTSDEEWRLIEPSLDRFDWYSGLAIAGVPAFIAAYVLVQGWSGSFNYVALLFGGFAAVPVALMLRVTFLPQSFVASGDELRKYIGPFATKRIARSDIVSVERRVEGICGEGVPETWFAVYAATAKGRRTLYKGGHAQWSLQVAGAVRTWIGDRESPGIQGCSAHTNPRVSTSSPPRA